MRPEGRWRRPGIVFVIVARVEELVAESGDVAEDAGVEDAHEAAETRP